MPRIIKKYKLESQFSNEYEFEVTRVKLVETKKTMITDDEGYQISDRHNPTITTETKYGITAISLPSRKPAKVIPLEVEDVNEGQALAFDSSLSTQVHQEQKPLDLNEPKRPRPVKLSSLTDNTLGANGRPASINLTKALSNDSKGVVPIPKSGEITWADNSNISPSNSPEPF